MATTKTQDLSQPISIDPSIREIMLEVANHSRKLNT